MKWLVTTIISLLAASATAWTPVIKARVTHVKDMAGVMYQLNKVQAGEWLVEHIESDETSCCYMADGGESMQHDRVS